MWISLGALVSSKRCAGLIANYQLETACSVNGCQENQSRIDGHVGGNRSPGKKWENGIDEIRLRTGMDATN